jgi:hypothetical protein
VEPVQHRADAVAQLCGWPTALTVHQLIPECDLEFGEELSIRTESNGDVVLVRQPAMPPVTFRDVCRHRRDGSTHLSLQVELDPRQRLGALEGEIDQIHGPLPDFKIRESM